LPLCTGAWVRIGKSSLTANTLSARLILCVLYLIKKLGYQPAPNGGAEESGF
jgi:hypothetical protein